MRLSENICASKVSVIYFIVLFYMYSKEHTIIVRCKNILVFHMNIELVEYTRRRVLCSASHKIVDVKNSNVNISIAFFSHECARDVIKSTM